MNFWGTYWGYLLCRVLGHKAPVRLLEKGNEECDCGADHTYKACSRCHAAVD